MVKDFSVKFEVDNFNGKNNFKLQKLKMHDFSMEQELQKALTGNTKRPMSTIDDNQEDVDERDISTIRLHLVDNVVFNIIRKETTTCMEMTRETLHEKICDKWNLFEEAIVCFKNERIYQNLSFILMFSILL